MKLTEEQVQLMFQKLKVNECPNCKSIATKSVNDVEYQLISFDRTGDAGNILGEMDLKPLASVECNECGHVMLFNLKTLGVVTK